MNKSKKLKDFTKLQFSDDFMFGIVMRNEKICKRILEIILDLKISKITYPEGQKSIDMTVAAKSIRLDVYVENAEHTAVYNIEMQTTLNKNLPKRSRYYQGLIDLNLLEKGNDYKHLKKSFVIFICTSDPFGRDAYVYTFENRCVQMPDLALGDDAVKIFLNAGGFKGKIGQELKGLLEYINTGIPTDSFTEKLETEVRKIRNNERWRRDYMTLEMKLNEEREEAYEEGLEEGRNILISLVLDGLLTDEQAAERAGLSLDEFQKKKQEYLVTVQP